MEKKSALSFLRYANYKNFYLVEPIAWAGHIAFAHMLVAEYKPALLVELGTQSGNSFFSFCQSVRQNKLKTKCVAIDCWQGDLQTGSYDETTYTAVKTYRDEHYAAFAELKKMTFDEALVDFANESIDILHIDGYHTYEAVEHDFHTWLPKVKPGGIILFHDINEYQNTFGAYRLWNEIEPLSEQTHFFHHSHGLGVWRKPGGQPLSSPLLNSLLTKGSKDAFLIDSFITAIADREVGEYKRLQSDGIIKKNIDHIAYADAAYTDNVNNFNKQLSEYKNVISNLESAVSKMSEYETVISKMSELESAVCKMSEDKTVISKMLEYETVISNLESTIYKMSEDKNVVSNLETTISNMKLTIQDLELTIQTLKFKMQTIYLEKEKIVCKLKLALQRVIFKYSHKIETQHSTLNDLLHSKSWRITKPLRYIANKFN